MSTNLFMGDLEKILRNILHTNQIYYLHQECITIYPLEITTLLELIWVWIANVLDKNCKVIIKTHKSDYQTSLIKWHQRKNSKKIRTAIYVADGIIYLGNHVLIIYGT